VITGWLRLSLRNLKVNMRDQARVFMLTASSLLVNVEDIGREDRLEGRKESIVGGQS
jgi:hypothetical protein